MRQVHALIAREECAQARSTLLRARKQIAIRRVHLHRCGEQAGIGSDQCGVEQIDGYDGSCVRVMHERGVRKQDATMDVHGGRSHASHPVPTDPTSGALALLDSRHGSTWGELTTFCGRCVLTRSTCPDARAARALATPP